jgi:hypothetical protein
LHAAAWSLLAARGIAAQATATVDVGASTVRYDGFLASRAASVTPAATWTRPGATLIARGSYLRFESGHRSLQGLIAASLFTPPALLPDRWRGEVTISGGGSSYADFASFWHATGEARLHFVGPGRGAWMGATAGRTSYGSAARPVAVAGIGGWARRGWLMLTASASRSFIGDTAYTDVESTADVGAGAWGLHGSVGARISSRGGGHGVYGAGEATRALSQGIALFVSGGRYPTDPVSGSVAGRYLTVGVRIRSPTPRRLPTWDPVQRGRPPAAADGDATLAPQIEIRPAGDRGVRLLVRAPGASSVELAADFTDWHPVVLERVMEEGAWQLLLPVASGLHRLNVRIDGGKWIAPAGTTRSADEFGSEVGIVAVP